METQPLPKKGAEPPIFGPCLLRPTAAWVKMSLGPEVSLGPDDIVLDGGAPSIFGPRPLWSNGCMDQDATWYGGRPRFTRHCVRWGPSSPPLKRHSPQFSANVRFGQTAGWTKMPLGIEVGFGPGDFVFDGDPSAPPEKKGTAPTQFLAHVYCGHGG